MSLIAVAWAATESAIETVPAAGGTGVTAMFGLNGWQFLAQLINFGLLIFVLRLVLYKPLVNFMEERSKNIADGLDKAELYKTKLKELETATTEALAKAEAAGREKIALASSQADKLLAEAKERASQHEAEARDKMAKAAEQYKSAALEEVRQQAGELVVLAAEKVLRGTLTKEVDAKLVDKALKEIKI
jgi:F-type H+-transporting ATPase subunit b